MEKHYRILGWLFVIWGLLLIVILTFGPMLPQMEMTPETTSALILVGIASLVAILYVITGWALLTRKPWARGVTIAASIIAIFNFPLGTALGVYGLWTMFSDMGREQAGPSS